MPVAYIIIATDLAANRHLGIVASATTNDQAVAIVQAFAFVNFARGSSLHYSIRDVSSASLYGPECQVNLLQGWNPCFFQED